jgi:hypothetical protein
MKRDVVVAVSLGFILGAFAALIAVRLPAIIRNVKFSQNTKTRAQISPAPRISVTNLPNSIEISSPADGIIATAKTLTLKGKTIAESIVTVETDSISDAQVASGDGSFLFPINLSEGTNTITVTSYNSDSPENTKTLTVFYTPENL